MDNMKSRLEDRNKAIELRKSGLSYKEIQHMQLRKILFIKVV